MRTRKCKECTKHFDVSRNWQVFCSSLCRLRFNKRNSDSCFYCGISNKKLTKDHVRPHANRTVSQKRYFRNVEYICSCQECNSTLNSNEWSDISGRFSYLIEIYIKKYKLYKPCIDWDDEELDELKYSLKRRIKNKLAKRRKNEERVWYLRMKLEEINSDNID